jgi:predicted transcriptional regulator
MPLKSAIDERLLELLEGPVGRMDLVRELKSYPTTVQGRLDKLGQQGKILRSRQKIHMSFVESKPGVGRYWKKLSTFLWLRADSSVMTPSGVVTVEVPYTQRYTLEESKKKHNVPFIAFSKPAVENLKQGWLSQKEILIFFKGREFGAVPQEIAQRFEVSLARASGILNKMRKAGLLERRGYWNAVLGRETPFQGRIKGYVYGLPGTEQAKKRIEQGEGLYSPHANAILVEIRKDSSLKRFTTYGKFEDELGQYETLKAIKILTQIYPSLVTATIGGQGFIYDKQHFTGYEIDNQVAYWERHVSIKKRLTGAIGAFHEAFTQHAMDLALKDMDIKVTFWRKIGKGKESYNIRLSNAKEIDRVLQVDFYYRGKLLWRHYYPIECKFYRGGATPEHLREFIDKLRFSSEFGEQITLQEGNQNLQVHVVKQNVHPILISPYYKKETHQQARKYHVELLPTWLLAKLAGDTLGKKLEMRKLFEDYLKQGGNIEAFLIEIFKRKTGAAKKDKP